MKLKASEYEAKDILKILREWTELTQKDFAESINVNLGTLQSYERGIRRCSFDVLLEMAKEHNIMITFEKN